MPQKTFRSINLLNFSSLDECRNNLSNPERRRADNKCESFCSQLLSGVENNLLSGVYTLGWLFQTSELAFSIFLPIQKLLRFNPFFAFSSSSPPVCAHVSIVFPFYYAFHFPFLLPPTHSQVRKFPFRTEGNREIHWNVLLHLRGLSLIFLAAPKKFENLIWGFACVSKARTTTRTR